MVIDAHSHYMPPQVASQTTFFKQYWSDDQLHLKLMDENGVDRAVLLYPTSDAHLTMGGWGNLCDVYNPAIAQLVARHPDRFIGAGILPIDAPDLMPQALLRIEDLGFNIISLASSYQGQYLDHPLFEEVYEFCSKKSIVIHVHSQIMNPIGEERLKDPLLSPVLEYLFDVSVSIGRMMMAGVFLKFPRMKFIFAHYGGVLPIVKDRFDTTYQMLLGRGLVKDLSKLPSEYFKRLYFDMSGAASLGTLLSALEVVDSDHILWGSDFPANRNLKSSLSLINQAQLSQMQKSSILGKNFLRLWEDSSLV